MGIALDVLRRLSSNLVRCIDVPTKTEPEQKQNINCFMIYSSISEGGEGGGGAPFVAFGVRYGSRLGACCGARCARHATYVWRMDLVHGPVFFSHLNFDFGMCLEAITQGGIITSAKSL